MAWAARLRGQAGPDLDADYPGSEPGQQCSLAAVAGADLQHLLAAGDLPLRGKESRHVP
jgi:hypothetical protein